MTLMFGSQNTLEKQYPRLLLSEIIRVALYGVTLLVETVKVMPNVAQS